MTIELSPTTIGILVGVATALVRLLPSTKPWWSFLPEKARFVPPLVVVLAGLTVGLITDPATWLGQLELALPALLAIVAPGALQSGASHSLAGAKDLAIKAAVKRSSLLLVLLIVTGCALNPHPVSPCAGLYCVSITVPGAPGSELACWDSQARAERALATRGCSVSGARAVCR